MKERILKSIPDSSLEAIPLLGNENNINWEDEGKEFSLNGDMYDVVRTKIAGGQTIIYCYKDKKEGLLLGQISDTAKSNSQNTGNNNKLPDIKLVYDYVIINHINYFIASSCHVRAFIHYDVALPQQHTSIIVPPPRA